MDLIDSQAAIDAIERLDIPEDMCVSEILSHIELAILTLPPAQGYAEFISWLLDEIWDEEMWELNYRAFPELLCRRLVRLGYLKEEGGAYVRLDKQTGGD